MKVSALKEELRNRGDKLSELNEQIIQRIVPVCLPERIYLSEACIVYGVFNCFSLHKLQDPDRKKIFLGFIQERR